MKLLLAEDEKDLSRALAAVLNHSGYDVTAVYDGEAAVEAAKINAYDVMVFDIMMPKMTGLEAVRAIRQNSDMTPVLFLTAKSEVDDRIVGLDAGADDYLTKPFAMGELLARVRSLTRRSTVYGSKELRFGAVLLDVEHLEMKSANSIRLANKEAHMMEYLMLNPNKYIGTDELFNHIWSDEPETDKGIVFVYVSFLNNKLRSIDADIKISADDSGNYILNQF
ncbi:MAG: response regulator transcription factor [Clostridia bacterium]|nr:response regulator transcription factor [Clostridia bacterium]